MSLPTLCVLCILVLVLSSVAVCETLVARCWLQPPCQTCVCLVHRYKLPEQEVSAAVETAMELVNMKEFMHRATHTLSGGQRQRVAIAGEALP